MKISKSRLSSYAFVVVLFSLTVVASAQEQPVILNAGTVLDGKGNVLHNVRITVQGGKIVAVTPQSRGGMQVSGSQPEYDLRELTVMPGWIDTHVHITYHFGPNGRAEDKSETPAGATLAGAGNAWRTLMAGFTTVQSVGSPEDKELRDSIERGVIPGPRILTALRPLTESKLTPEQIREYVRKLKADGADVVKIFASKSIREGGGQTLSDEQLQAACGEARAQGLRSLVHAYRTAVKAAALAGCTQVEHGTYASDDDLRAMAEHGTYFDPQVGLVIHNYIDNKAKYLGIGNYNEEGFAKMKEALPLNAEMFARALKTPGLKIVFGTDAVAGAHGRNAEEFIYRVRDGGQQPVAALVAANALAAESLGMGSQLGSIAPGMRADIIALDGDPVQDITAVRRVVFVMKEGKVYRNEVTARK